MKPIHIIAVIIVVLIASLFAWNDNPSHLPIRVFRRTGEVSLGGTKIFADTITCASSSAFSIDISAAGFSTVPRVQILPIRNTGNALLVPNVAIKSISTTTIVVNVTEFNGTTLLGVDVGTIQFVAIPTDIILNVQAVGN